MIDQVFMFRNDVIMCLKIAIGVEPEICALASLIR